MLPVWKLCVEALGVGPVRWETQMAHARQTCRGLTPAGQTEGDDAEGGYKQRDQGTETGQNQGEWPWHAESGCSIRT